jgi:hypothetical protein
MPENMPWKEAIVEVLSKAKGAMHYTEIAEEIIAGKLRKDVGATPANTVARFISEDLGADAGESTFVRTERGYYMLRSKANAAPLLEEDEEVAGAVEGTGVVNAFGMYWRRELVFWSKGARLYGKQAGAEAEVDFSPQHGVYLLHDHGGVVYVGRTTDQPLGTRLFQHTSDRLNGRWDRFSWFGLYPVKEDGSLNVIGKIDHTENALIVALEALLIEGLEPPQNRKRGDEFSGVEYLQVEDPKIRDQKMAQMLEEMKSKIGK